jgi:hypothetical protein
MTIGCSGTADYPIVITSYGSGEDPIINGSDVETTWEPVRAWKTAWNVTLTNDYINPGTDVNLRQVLPANTPSYSGTKIRITAEATVGANTILTGTSIGLSTSTDDFDSAPTRITWVNAGGGNGITIPAGEAKLSDEIDFAFDKTKRHLVHFYMTPTAQRYQTTGPLGGYYKNGTGDNTLTQTVTYSAAANQDVVINKLEVYAQAGYIYEKTFTNEPRVVVEDGTYLTYVLWDTDVATTFADASAGSWSMNGTTAYVWCTDNADPDTHTMEVAAVAIDADHGWGNNILIDGVSYITIQNIQSKYATRSGILAYAGSDQDMTDIVIQDCTIHNCGLYGITVNNEANGVDEDHPIMNITIDSNTVSYTGSHGILFNRKIEDSTISNNTVSYSGWYLEILTGTFGITTWSPSLAIAPSGIIMENNTIHHTLVSATGGVGCGIGLDDYTQDSIVRYNVCYSNQGSGLHSNSNSANCQFYYNCVYSNNTEESASEGGANISGADGIEIYNNVFYDNSNSGIYFAISLTSATIKNNILMDNGDYEIHSDHATAPTSDYNCIYHQAGGDFMYFNGSAYDWADWKTQTSGDANSINADPRMTDPASDDFTLQMTSPCINAGTDVGLTEDYAGNPAPKSGTTNTNGLFQQISGALFQFIGSLTEGSFDIGAYEYRHNYKFKDGHLYLRLSDRFYLRINVPEFPFELLLN